MAHILGRVVGFSLIFGSAIGGACGYYGINGSIKDGQLIISTNATRNQETGVETSSSPGPATSPSDTPDPAPTIVISIPPEKTLEKPVQNAQPPVKTPAVEKIKFIQPTFLGNPDVVQPIDKYEIRIPSNWVERRNDTAKDNNFKFGTSEYASQKMSKDYQGELYLFEDGSWIMLEKVDNGVRVSSSPSSQEHELRIYTATSRNTERNQEEVTVYTQNQGSKTFTVKDNVYLFSDLLR